MSGSSPRQDLFGLVLAGGASSRFGSDKAAAQLNGRPLLALALDRLKRDCARQAVSARPGSWSADAAAAFGATVLHDAAGDARGPLAGVKAGLGWAREHGAPLLAVIPCDTPRLPDGMIARLASAIEPGDGGATARTSDGLQSLCTVLRVELADPLAALLAAGHHPPVHEWLADVRAREVAFAQDAAFLNVNTQGDLARAESLDSP